MSRLAAIALPLLVAGPLAFAEGEAEGTIDEQLASLDEAIVITLWCSWTHINFCYFEFFRRDRTR